MFSKNGTYYTEEHSITFGNIIQVIHEGLVYDEFNPIANTWADWHLIPSTRPSIAHPNVVTKYVDIPGVDGMFDLSDYLTGRPTYGRRKGSISFYVDNDHEYWERIREKIVNVLHGRDLWMVLEDDPGYFYKGRFTVGNYESGENCSSITLSYDLEPFKKKVKEEGSTPLPWDTFNFENDYDYYSSMGSEITVNNQTKTFSIYMDTFSVTPVAVWVSGTVSITFGGSTQILSSAGSKTLGTEISWDFDGHNTRTLTVSGTGSVKVKWRGGSL